MIPFSSLTARSFPSLGMCQSRYLLFRGVSSSKDPQSQTPLPTPIRNKQEKHKQKWIDSLRIVCKAGHGGNGHPKYGGVGGKGGDCIIRVTPSSKVPNLYDLFKKRFRGDSKRQRIEAQAGQNSSRNNIFGTDGADAVLSVPAGVSIQNDAGRIVYELNAEDSEVKVALGGEGGQKHNQWLGQVGQTKTLRLNLKLLADLGLVGFPNAGKSTLLKAISKARPKIASYPFTTLTPNIGHLAFDDERVITMADLPGLIEGAHFNIGMGHRFLRHVERTKVLVFVVDVQGFQLNPNSQHRNAFETVVILNRELELYQSDLLDKPCVLLVNKMDSPDAKAKFQCLEKALKSDYSSNVASLSEEWIPHRRVNFVDVIPMSAKFSGKSVFIAKQQLRKILDRADEKERHIDHQTLALELKSQTTTQNTLI